MAEKNFKLRADQIETLIEDMGRCFVSDMVTVEGMKVGYLYREEADFEDDSGWRFLSGTESDEYMNDPDHFSIIPVNAVCNYDTDIIDLLDAEEGSEFQRDPETNEFVELVDDLDGEDLDDDDEFEEEDFDDEQSEEDDEDE